MSFGFGFLAGLAVGVVLGVALVFVVKAIWSPL